MGEDPDSNCVDNGDDDDARANVGRDRGDCNQERHHHINPIFSEMRGPRMIVVRGGGGKEQDDDHRCNDALSARIGGDGWDCNLSAIDGHDWEKRHRHVNPVSPDAKGLGTVVVRMMPLYDDCHHRDNDDKDDNNDGLAQYLATGAALPPPTLLSSSLSLLIGKKNRGKKRGD